MRGVAVWTIAVCVLCELTGAATAMAQRNDALLMDLPFADDEANFGAVLRRSENDLTIHALHYQSFDPIVVAGFEEVMRQVTSLTGKKIVDPGRQSAELKVRTMGSYNFAFVVTDQVTWHALVYAASAKEAMSLNYADGELFWKRIVAEARDKADGSWCDVAAAPVKDVGGETKEDESRAALCNVPCFFLTFWHTPSDPRTFAVIGTQEGPEVAKQCMLTSVLSHLGIANTAMAARLQHSESSMSRDTPFVLDARIASALRTLYSQRLEPGMTKAEVAAQLR